MRVEGLTLKRAGRALFDPLTFSVQAGEVLSIFGKNGSGKTTLLRALAGLFPHEKTAIQRQESLCFVGHQDWQSLDLTVEETLEFWAKLYGGKVDKPVGAFSLGPLLNNRIKTLSQGQRQRVALSRVLCGEFKLWLLDEPFVHLDAASKRQVVSLMEQYADKGGALIFSSHEPSPFHGHSIELRSAC